jgi:PhnB protein
MNPHLIFNGNCEEAFRAYEKIFGGKILMMLKYGEAPGAEQAPPDWRDKIIHATFVLGNASLAGADLTSERYQKPQGFYVIHPVADPVEAERIFSSLAEGGEVQMPIQETFWALRFGVVVDRFGTPWEINCGKS